MHHTALISEEKMTVEEAYQSLANEILECVSGEQWDFARSSVKIFSRMTQTDIERKNGESSYVNEKFSAFDVGMKASAAALYLRDNLLATTGQRIWGLTFTLYPDGKFNIEYDYNKPEDYEETDEVISGDQANASLGKLE
ncbi:antitoxin YezG family protein [Uliginosibacterium aquaticum]|uniref:DUF600 family protein n=1 Tax=Uliginosibacterium aquaticum TaxID=2731212 RepID=A0ABX2IDA1_9RHOO|nr:hypothetical protein [Uliginosibacterium aquaticum]NSL54559.1 hypothetical protein [Uliginosibacterium aquaticum]